MTPNPAYDASTAGSASADGMRAAPVRASASAGCDDGAWRAAEEAARLSYGRLVAYLAARCRDVAAAEDALADAFLAALESWPRSGVPERPEAWLLTAARRRLIDAARHASVAAGAEEALRTALDAADRDSARAMFPDDRLVMLFVCAHPAIDEAIRTPLMLQTVLGLDAARIASAFLVPPATMAQRLVRAKARIREAGVAFEIPTARDLPSRLEAVLEAVYTAYGSSWEDVAGADPRRAGMAAEAIWLGRLIVASMPGEPEARGLLALMLHCEARRTARRDAAGRYVPLDRQDVARWSRAMIEKAEALLLDASRAGRPGRYQLEAAIQSVHARRALTGRTDRDAIALLYEGLIRTAPTIGAMVGYAAAIAEVRGSAVGLAILDAMPRGPVASYQPYWALRAHLLDGVGMCAEAEEARARAIGLSEDPAVRAFLSSEPGRGQTPAVRV